MASSGVMAVAGVKAYSQTNGDSGHERQWRMAAGGVASANGRQ